MYDFVYTRPSSVAEAAKVLAKAGEDAVYLAGGQTLIPALKLRLRKPSVVVDLGALKGLDSIAETNDGVLIGALCTHTSVAGNKLVKDRIPALAALADGIGDPQVRNRGTLGGSIANADPAAEETRGHNLHADSAAEDRGDPDAVKTAGERRAVAGETFRAASSREAARIH